ncbi:MAG: EamA family transporter RarD [Acidimicrobiia bacterium]|nr:EamA family transporter RarD [Acidimicrobiia bacterium]
MRRGVVFGVSAYLLWGVSPVFWKTLQSVGSIEIIGHRVIWSLALLMVIVTTRRTWPTIRSLSGPTLARLALAGGLLATNWLIYVWGVNNGHIVDASLGYFINPLVSVLLGVTVLRERLTAAQWLAIGVAAAGVAIMAFSVGALPWIALVLAASFGTYGLLKKQSSVGAFESLTVEVAFLAIPAAGYLGVLGGDGAFGTGRASVTWLLVLTGAATTLPLVLFGASAARIPLSMLGFLQYLAPSLQLLIGVFVYGEVIGGRLPGFILVWLALAIYAGAGTQAPKTVGVPAT